MFDAIARACEQWPRAELPAEYFEPVHSDVPVLVLSGDLDPATPPAWGEQVAATLSRALHVVVPGVGHGTWNRGCVPRLMAEFVERGDLEGLDPSCTQRLHRPPFFVSFAGPPP
jgi:pimeloyl-ACP methyl ester carboxylesterase